MVISIVVQEATVKNGLVQEDSDQAENVPGLGDVPITVGVEVLFKDSLGGLVDDRRFVLPRRRGGAEEGSKSYVELCEEVDALVDRQIVSLNTVAKIRVIDHHTR